MLPMIALDPISKEPDFKYCAVKVQKYKKPFQRIVVVGAGAGAHGFVRSYRELNKDDEITIFSKEDHPFITALCCPITLAASNAGSNW
jgi:ferredoxin-nitrate reductase